MTSGSRTWGYRKDVFIVHSKHDSMHSEMFRALSEGLDEIGLSAYQYSDWEWLEVADEGGYWTSNSGLDRDLAAAYAEFDNYRDMFGIHRKEKEHGDVDRKELVRLISTAPAIVVLETEAPPTEGIVEELAVLRRLMMRRPSRRPHIGAVRSTETGFLSRDYPEWILASLQLVPGASRSVLRSLLLLLTMRVYLNASADRTVSRAKTQPAACLKWLDEMWQRTVHVLEACDSQLLEPPHDSVSKLIEDLLCISADTLAASGLNDSSEARHIGQRVATEPWAYCELENLGERSLRAALRVFDVVRDEGRDFLFDFLDHPVCAYGEKRRIVATAEIASAVELLERIDGRPGVEFFQDIIESAVGSRRRADYLRALGKYALTQSSDVKRDILRILKSVASCLSESPGVRASGLNEIGTFGTEDPAELTEWLTDLFRRTEDQARVNVLGALFRVSVDPPATIDLACAFLSEADPNSRLQIASMAWHVDSGRLYQALEEPENDRMRVMLLFSRLRARRRSTVAQLLSGIKDGTRYERTCCATFVEEWLREFTPTPEERQEIVEVVKPCLGDGDLILRVSALRGLVAAGETSCLDETLKMIRQLSLDDRISLVCPLLETAGDFLPCWPVDSILTQLLFHPQVEVRHSACYLAGAQRRENAQEKLQDLAREDFRSVFGRPQHIRKLIGRTVAEAAGLAIEKIEGKVPVTRLRGLFSSHH